jgi:hypothetical protein
VCLSPCPDVFLTPARLSEDIASEDIKTLGSFKIGDEVFVESDDPTDVLDDTDAQTEAMTRIWWRARLVAPAHDPPAGATP